MTPVCRSDCGSDRRVRGPAERLPESAQLIRSTSVRCNSVTTARSGTAGRSAAAGSTDVIAAGTLVTTALEQATAAAEQPTTVLAVAGCRAAGLSTRSGTGVRTGSCTAAGVATGSRTAASVSTGSRTGVGTRSRTAGLGAAGCLSRSATAGGATGVAPLVMAAEQTGVNAVHADDDCEGGDDCRPLHLEISLTFGLIA
jgi:hypothetical protein